MSAYCQDKKIPYIDFAKGYAIFTIVLFHTLLVSAGWRPLLLKMIFFGATGVHLFFFLSGFGLGLSYGSAEPVQFYKRRVSKIWLPFVLVLTISLIVALVTGVYKDSWDAWLAGVGLYQMFMERYIASFGGHLWFISTIIQFYIAYPLIRKMVDKGGGHTWTVVIGALAISVTWWIVVFSSGKTELRIWNSFFLQFLWEFVLGLALASAYCSGEKLRIGPFTQRPDFWNQSPHKALLVGGVMLFLAFNFHNLGVFGNIGIDIPYFLGYIAFSVAVYQIGERYLPFVKQFFLWIGSFSLSVYLVHILGLRFFLKATEAAGLSVNIWLLLSYIPFALLLGRMFEPVSIWWTNRVGGLLFGQVQQNRVASQCTGQQETDAW